MVAVCTEKLLKDFQRERTQGTDHTKTSVLHPGLPSWGINLLLPTVPRPRLGRIAIHQEGEGWQLGLAAALRACPPRSLPIPSAAAARGWEQVPFSLTGLGAPHL